MTLTILAPTDSQLAYIKSLCETQGWQYPGGEKPPIPEWHGYLERGVWRIV